MRVFLRLPLQQPHAQASFNTYHVVDPQFTDGVSAGSQPQHAGARRLAITGLHSPEYQWCRSIFPSASSSPCQRFAPGALSFVTGVASCRASRCRAVLRRECHLVHPVVQLTLRACVVARASPPLVVRLTG